MAKKLFILMPFLFITYFLDSIILGKLCIAYIFILCLYHGLKEKYFVNPLLLFSITPLSLILYFNIGMFYMVDLTVNTIILAAINMMAFIYALNYTRPFNRVANCIGVANNKSLIVLSVFFYIISLMGQVVTPLAYILPLFATPAITCAVKTKKPIMFLFIFSMFIIAATGITSKTAMLTYCISILICIEKYCVKTDKQKKLIKILSVVGVIFMVFAFSFANKGKDMDGMGVEYYEKQGITWNYNSDYFMPYMYLTNGWTNLQYVTETQNTRSYGLWMAAPIMGYTGLKKYFDKEYRLESYSSFNTFGYITVGFKDFGYWLSIIMSLFLGYFVKKIYSRYELSRSPFDVATYVMVALATLEMFFSNHFLMQSYPFTLLILMELTKKSISTNKIIEIES